ncbi:4-hydroxy-tetrahydrodipicolinate synthase [Aliikangiella marina]|uniref:4-hydroxy-tetrahydrodipicolinate synthase n=1 Tax=Aliikangiella marina TaxID=1712262 RepID=A0A545TIH5_9GAMM|nr:4-hydroxy-tetrahydrodipicolinate synthase [Aliikangiella marina]TQV76976.1 4-hydroxy-tetrahydrodipicolinate synthase [Aliikangiella marina]
MFRGSLVALVTPMKSDLSIDYDALSALVDWHIESGTHGLVVMGTTGESSLVSVDEHVAVVKAVIEQVDKRIPVIAGCGSASTSKAVELVNQLNQLQPDGFLCVTPYYLKPTQNGLYAHFSAVADACEAPLILYNVPGRTCCDLADETVARLSSHPKIVAIKDATGDLERAKNLIEKVPGFIYLSGDDATALDFMALGGHGVISVTGNIVPKEFSQFCDLMAKKQPESTQKAKELFNRINSLNSALFVESNPIPVKWALAKVGRMEPYLRLPLTQPEPASQQVIQAAMQQSAVI